MEDMSTLQSTYTLANPTATQPAILPTAGPARRGPAPEEIQLRRAQLELDRNEVLLPRTEWEHIIENSIMRVLIVTLFSIGGVLFMICVAWVGNVVFGKGV